jgi:hypothetical protein
MTPLTFLRDSASATLAGQLSYAEHLMHEAA